jgi:ribonuclease P protein component
LVYRYGRKFGDPYFLIIALPNGATRPRLGLSISARTVGNAVNRNRIKRIIRDSFRLKAPEFPGLDIVVNSRNSASEASNDTLRKSLEQHWCAVVKRCGD